MQPAARNRFLSYSLSPTVFRTTQGHHQTAKYLFHQRLIIAMQLRLNIPPLTRILLGLLLTISITYQVTRYLVPRFKTELLALVPQWSIFYPWVYVTATYAEGNVITLFIAGATILYGGKYLERAWGSLEFGKFVAVVTILPNVAATFIYILWFAITMDSSRAYVPQNPLSPITIPFCPSAILLLTQRVSSGSLIFKAPYPFKELSLSPLSSLSQNIPSRFYAVSSRSGSSISLRYFSRQTRSLGSSSAQTLHLSWPGPAFSRAGHISDSIRNNRTSPAPTQEVVH